MDAYFVLATAVPSGVAAPASSGLTRLGIVSHQQPQDNLARAVKWAFSRRPVPLVGHNWTPVLDAFRAWLEPPYDLAVVTHRLYDAFAPVLSECGVGAVVVDVDNVEGSVLRHRRRRAVVSRSREDRSAGAALVDHVRDLVHIVDARRWDRHQRAICSQASVALVCSDVDRAKLAVPNATVIRNGYELTTCPVGRPDAVTAPPVLTMVGHFGYVPNLDAARFLVKDVLPRVRQDIPDATVRLVGHLDKGRQVLSLAGDDVDVRGPVDDVADELATTDLVVAPLRFGGGTRIKLLEAFAHRVPTVTTTVGCEGLPVEDEVNLLVGDTAGEFAAQCVRLLLDIDLRLRLTTSAERLFLEGFQWSSARHSMGCLAEAVVFGPPVAAPVSSARLRPASTALQTNRPSPLL